MGTLGNCCCACCMEPAEMPWTKFALKNTLTNCTTGGGYTPPEASFIRVGCCYQATMNVDCDWEVLCQDYAKQTATVSLTLDDYQVQIPYITTGETPSCPCTLVQRRSGTREITRVSSFFHKRKLVQIQVTVGKTNYDCGVGSPSCKFYIAVNYWYETKEVLTDLCWGYGYETSERSCVGFYRDGTCSYTNSWTEALGYETCDELTGVLDTEVATDGSTCIGRIKYYDVLPVSDVTIDDLDEASPCAPVTCGVCDDEDCFLAFPEYSGPEARFFDSLPGEQPCPCDPPTGCYDYNDGITSDSGLLICYRDSACPEFIEGDAETYTVPVFDCATVAGETCCTANGSTCEVSGYEPDGFQKCYYFVDKSTNEIVFDTPTTPDILIPGITGSCLGGDDPPPVSAGCFKPVETSDCDGTDKCKDCRTVPCTYVFCPDLSGSVEGITDFAYCKREITDYSCTYGSVQHFTAGNFCINTPSTTLGFA